jgi:BirA family transcriptional regulator, biotin operon repressor / biotin---[acetyl-CoA-carboxylase] ligase
VPASPYSDLDRPPLVAAALRRTLVVPGGLWRRVDLLAETGSTNADALDAARAGEPEGLVVVAERQTGGRGRNGRGWLSPPRAGLTVSVLLRPGAAVPDRGWSPVPPRAYGWLPLLAGVALLDAVRAFAEVPATLKWPNDLLVPVDGRDAKCAGILAEATGGAVVLGIGLNVTTRADELPTTPGGLSPTSLRLAGAALTDRAPLLRALLRALADRYARWRDAAGDAQASGLRQSYRERCATLGRPVRVLLPGGEELAGGAVTVDEDGHLVVNTPAGPHTVAAGDVLHVR